MQLYIKDLKNLLSKINLGIEKSKINPKASWLELETVDNVVYFKVSNSNYYLEASIKLLNATDEYFHSTIIADNFISLISKLDVDYINIYEKLNSVYIETDASQYQFPVIKELGKTKTIESIDFIDMGLSFNMLGKDLNSIATVNTKGLVDSLFSKEIQQYIYVDNIGAITFTENIYINDFTNKYDYDFKILLTATQAKLLEIFKDYDEVNVSFNHEDTFDDVPTKTNKLCLSTDNLKLVLITQTENVVNKFPSIRLRALTENSISTHVVIDKKQLDKALARLMIFDKKFDITVLDYSKLVFKENELELGSKKNKNCEKIPYIRAENSFEHESVIRFADLVKQLKAVTSKELDLSYGDRPAIIINSDIKQLIPEIKVVNRV